MNTHRILLTGANGFVGKRLTAALINRYPGARVIRTDRSGNFEGPGEARALELLDADVVDALIADIKPTTIVHLAALSAVQDSILDPRATWQVNVMGTLELVMAVQRHAPDCHFVYVSSAEVYGQTAFSGVHVTEDMALQPANPYAASKAAADIMVREAAMRGLFATLVRPFNHTGPGQDDRFVIPAFCSQVARIEKGLQPPEMLVGELNDERDFLSADDVVDLYVRIIEAGRTLPSGTVINAASGASRRIGDILDTILAASSSTIAVKVDPSRLRKTRVPRIVGDSSRARELLGWQPTKPFDTMLRETLDYWRTVV
ncbi:MAG: NAD-dependent epimerase/dehydratase family protein [Verrucomicrobiaceae bacterium]|nr:MAG: NAD-dependent epimerase/dehydratase family protein [Verrucomicrobiaceae bacterium]